MKKSIILALVIMFVLSNIKAQLKMGSNGNIDIQTNPVPNDYTRLGLSFSSSSSTTFDGSLTNFGFKCDNTHTATSLDYIGIYGASYYSTAHSVSKAIGIYGMAGNANAGYNYAVAGILKGTRNGAGIFGASYGNSFVNTDGNYAGYFNGPVKVTGSFQVNNFINYNTSTYNAFIGYNAAINTTTGSNITAIGNYSLYSNTTGASNTANGSCPLYYNTSGSQNTAVGKNALFRNVTGSNNTAVGYYAGLGSSGVSFTNCTFVGANSYLTQARSNVTMLGYGISNSQCTGDNQLCIGNTSITQINAAVSSITTYSDARYKTNVKDNIAGLDFILKLKPVTYNVKPMELHKIWGTPDSLIKDIDFSDAEKQIHIGLIAQDVEKAAIESNFDFPGLDKPRNEKEVYCLRYTDFIMPMIKSIQELNSNNNLFKTEIDSLRKILSQTISDYNLKLNELQESINKCCGEENLKKASVGNMNEKTTDASISKAILYQNAPNPFSKETEIKCFIPKTSVKAAIYIYDMQGTQIKKLQINNRENISISIQGSELKAGMYMYSLIIDGKEIDTKRMILTE